MSTSRDKLEHLVVILLEEDLKAWPVAGLIAFVKDRASSLDASQSVRARLRKRQIENLLQTAILEHDLVEAPTSAKH